ncbi:MAG: penicillin-binding transpeptidase domain-containing protein [Tepidiformaceae bacterium]
MLTSGGFERRLSATGLTALGVMLVFFGGLAYWQVFRTDLANEDRNPRVLSAFYDPSRGSILDRDGNVLVETLGDGTRYYHDASVAQLVGYLDPRYGSQGIELAFNDVLSGTAPSGWDGAIRAEFDRERPAGNDVVLTIDPAVQAAAAAALGSQKGAVVAIDPRNGEVLAMVSVPTYDPGSLATAGQDLFEDPNSPLLNRATQGLYPPGSTFKTVTASGILERKIATPETIVTCPGEIVIDGFPISCSNTAEGVGTYPFKSAFTFSVNAIFAELGVKLGWAGLTDIARRYGFDSALDFTLETAPSQLHRKDSKTTKTLLASTSFGQGELLATPLQMAEVAATIANGGVRMRPHLTLAEQRNGKSLGPIEPSSSTRVISDQLAATMREFMVSVVANGQANGVNNLGVAVGGKTGTAEAGDGTSHAWFIAFAPAEAPTVAVAVVVENGGRGGVVASPIAGQVLRAALAR